MAFLNSGASCSGGSESAEWPQCQQVRRINCTCGGEPHGSLTLAEAGVANEATLEFSLDKWRDPMEAPQMCNGRPFTSVAEQG